MDNFFNEAATTFFSLWATKTEICNYLFSVLRKYGKVEKNQEEGDIIELFIHEEEGTKYYLMWNIEKGLPFVDIRLYTQEKFYFLTSNNLLELIKEKYPLAEEEIYKSFTQEILKFIFIDHEKSIWEYSVFDDQDDIATSSNLEYVIQKVNEYALPNKQKIVVLATTIENEKRVTYYKAVTVGKIRERAKKLQLNIDYCLKDGSPEIYKPYSKAG